MASSDVIELGSSDDEAEPVPKKKKPMLNAMVHFPNEVPGLVIKPVKPTLPDLQKVLASGAVTITNVKKGKDITQVNKTKPNGRSVPKFVHRPPVKLPLIRNVSVMNPMAINNLSVNPLSLVKKQTTRVQASKLSLPPGITVKRTATSQNILPNILSNRKKQNLKRKQPEKIITTVELDDEEIPLTPGTSPQWYLRPEEQCNKPVENKEDETKQENNTEKTVTMELENNKEPDTRNYIEITIEDSPIKPFQAMRGFEVGSELPITIEDSPIKHIKSVKDQPCESDNEAEKSNVTEPQSKKRLNYPKNEEGLGQTGAQNILEIDLIPSAVESKEEITVNTGEIYETKTDSETEKVDILRTVDTVLITKEVKDEEKLNEPNTDQKTDSGEFHPIYQKFIDLCFELENSDDMAKIVEKKIKTYYRQCPKDYVESEEFTDMVSSKIFAMKGAPDKMYLYIKDIVDELNMQRKSAKAVEITNKENKNAEDKNYAIEDEGEYDTKRRRQIRKLDKTIKKLHRAIQKLEEQEVEFEDEEDSVYLLTERYKERLIRVHAKFCQLTNTKMPSEPRIQIEARPGFPAGPAKRLEKWVNKKVPIGTPLPFPDFHDVLRCVRDANEEDRLGWNEADIMEEARDLFTRCGKKLQRRRQENEWRIAAARISHDVSTLDPAEKSDDLKNKLEQNKTLAAKKELELLNKYADKQNQLKLVGEEIGDKEADESPMESEDDEVNDGSNSLEDKQKRKERLKRLLHEKTRKMSSEKENISDEAKVNSEKNFVVEEDKKMECVNAVSEKTENNKEIQLIKETEVNSHDPPINISEDGPSNEEKKEKTNYSDLYDVDSDIDELHLLQKLYSENEINSSTQESDSDTRIAISDTLESDSDNENVKISQSDDIISIENSSYSESEETKYECESARASESVNDKRIDGLLLQNAEVLLPSSTSRNKMDIDEENILLASSDEENDVDTNLHVDNIKDSSCDIKSSSDFCANNDCELVLSNCDDNSLENDVEMYEFTLSEEEKDKINKKITSTDSANNALDHNQDHFEFNDIVIQESNIQLGNNDELDDKRKTLDSIEENQNNFQSFNKSQSNDIILNEVTCDEANCITGEIVCKNVTTSDCDVKNCNCKGNFDRNNAINEQIPIDGVELMIASKEKNSEHSKDSFKEFEICPDTNIIEGHDDSVSNSIKTICTQQDFTECTVTDVDEFEIAKGDSSLTNLQNTCEGVEFETSV